MSLKKIASLAGCSTSTVSRVLNNTSQTAASDELRDKIWEIAREINYIPNESARSLKKQPDSNQAKIIKICVVLARVASLTDDPFFYEMFRDIEDDLFKYNAHIDRIIHTDETLKDDLKNMDGVIILGRCSDKMIKHIKKFTSNIIGIWRNPMNFSIDEVVCDGHKAATLAMEHLLELGHRSIAYIGDCSYESRYVGYCDTLIKHNIPLDFDMIKQTNQGVVEANKAIKSLIKDKLANKVDFTAILCANDITAVEVLNTISLSKKMKNKISIISIDNIKESQNTTPFLTTIDIPRREMAHMANIILLDRISSKHKETVRVEFPCRIIRRDSCYKIKE